MHLGIDLGSVTTKLGMQANGQFQSIGEIPAVLYLLPGSGRPVFDPSAEGAETSFPFLIMLRDDPDSWSSLPLPLDTLWQEYFSLVRNRFALGPLESVAISYPAYWGMGLRRPILTAAGQVFQAGRTHLIPEHLAAWLGHSQKSEGLAPGSYLWVDAKEKCCEFSFLSISASGACLEAQLHMNNDPDQEVSNLKAFMEGKLRKAALALGMADDRDWLLSGLTTAGNHMYYPGLMDCLRQLFPKTTFIDTDNGAELIVHGLSCWPESLNRHAAVKWLYPFRFLLGSSSQSPQLTPLSFDAADIGILTDGLYWLTTLVPPGTGTEPGIDYISYKIYEQYCGPNQPVKDPVMVAEFSCLASNRDPYLVYYNAREHTIDMETGTFPQTPVSVDLLDSLVQTSRQRMLEVPFINPALRQDLQKFHADDPPSAVSDHLESTRLRLLALIDLLSTS